MRIFAGTSGFSYDEWRGSFYPQGLKSGERLEYYSRQLPAVEINNTFYRMPSPSMLQGFRERTPDDFRFVLKAPRSITHNRKLADCGERVAHLTEVASALGDKLGPLLFQLPPNFQKNLERLASFLSVLPSTVRAAFEFRHPTWFEDQTYALLREHGAALCIAEVDDQPPVKLATAPFAYLRLRRPDYADEDLTAWAETVKGLGVREVYAFFKHERRAPELAAAFGQRFQ